MTDNMTIENANISKDEQEAEKPVREWMRAPEDLPWVGARSPVFKMSATIFAICFVLNFIVTGPQPAIVQKAPNPVAGYAPPMAKPLGPAGDAPAAGRSPLADPVTSLSPLQDNAPAPALVNKPPLVVPKVFEPSSDSTEVKNIRSVPKSKNTDSLVISPD